MLEKNCKQKCGKKKTPSKTKKNLHDKEIMIKKINFF